MHQDFNYLNIKIFWVNELEVTFLKLYQRQNYKFILILKKIKINKMFK